MQDTLSYIDSNAARSLGELKQLLAIPSVSTNKEEHGADVVRCASWLADHMRSIGLQDVQVFPTAGHPVSAVVLGGSCVADMGMVCTAVRTKPGSRAGRCTSVVVHR